MIIRSWTSKTSQPFFQYFIISRAENQYSASESSIQTETITIKRRVKTGRLAEVNSFRVPRLPMLLILLSVNLCVFYINTTQASQGHWILVDEDYYGFFQSLSSHTQWSFNATRGPDDRWMINLTTSFFG
jgi:hypothetical protein